MDQDKEGDEVRQAKLQAEVANWAQQQPPPPQPEADPDALRAYEEAKAAWMAAMPAVAPDPKRSRKWG